MKIPPPIQHPEIQGATLSFAKFCEMIMDQIQELNSTVPMIRASAVFLMQVQEPGEREVDQRVFDLMCARLLDEENPVQVPHILITGEDVQKPIRIEWGRMLLPFINVFAGDEQ